MGGLRWAAIGLAAGTAIAANAVRAADSKEAHLQAAAAAAGQDLKGILSICDPRTGRRAPPSANLDPEPAKVFDNLYFLGIGNVSAWALTTSDGIIVLDALDNPGEAQQYIEGGLRKLGLDPSQIKYVVVTHAHGDHYGGAQYLADKFHAHIVMSDIDWKVLEGPPRANYPANWGAPPKRDISVKNGDKLTLGDTTIEFYVTPPHTPGTISIIMPLKDGNARHVGGEWGGTAFNFAPTAQNFATYAASAERFAKIARDKGVDVPLSNHSTYDNAFEKIAALKTRRPGQPHPFVTGPDSEQRYLTVAAECAKAMQVDAK
jgi:metallo-beta-lactamase class B